MLLNYQAFLAKKCAMTLLCFLLLFPVHALCLDNNSTSPTLLVGVTVLPPVCMKNADNQWEGFGVEIWKTVAQRMGVPFEFREFNSLESLLGALEKKDIDIIPTLAVNDQLDATMDFSQSYLQSGLAIGVPTEDTNYRWIKVTKNIFSPHILKVIALLLLMSLIFGIIVWLFERRRNIDMFGDGYVKGIGNGIWWAIVTMSTVGYGDKAPETAGGRIVAFIWMIFSIVFIAAFTATITSQLTIGELSGKVRGFHDLYDKRVGCLLDSEGCDFLIKKGVAVIPFQYTQKGLSAVDSKRIDAFVGDEHILKYIVKKEFSGRLRILDRNFDEYFLSIALQQSSPLRKPINKALLKIMKTENWTEILNRYIR